MKKSWLHAVLERLVQGVVDRLLRHVTWHAAEKRSLSRQADDHYPLVIILGREHYSERKKSYPALQRRDLQKVLREELADEPPTLALLEPIGDDRREVTFFRLERDLIESLPRSLFVIPESVLLRAQLAQDSWAEVERQDYRYFLFPDGPSQPAGGALEQRDLVAMAAGADPDRAPEEWRGSDEIASRLRRALTSLSALSWWSCRNPLPRSIGAAGIAWKPIGLTAGLMLFAYLALSSIYLQALLSQRDGALSALGPDIQQGLAADNEARDYEVRRDALIELWSGRSDTQRLWQGVSLALQNSARVNQLDLRDGRIGLRGEAPDATEILTVIASTPGFLDVSFDAPVRSGRGGRQNFALSFVLADARAGPEKGDE